jgi:GR25 family glycosyltransferase involved in LPS biosynthesis
LPAVDGERLDMAALAADPAIGKDIAQCYGKGAIGNALSHLAMWHEAIETNSTLTVCENDAIFNRRFSETAQRTIDGLPTGWDMVLWGWNFHGEMVFDMLPGVSPALCGCDQNRMRHTLCEFQEQDIVPQPFKLLRAFGTPCYSVSPKGAQVLKSSCFPIRPLNVHFPGINRGLA